MYNLEQLHKKINRFYDKGEIFVSYIEQTSLFPLEISLLKIQQSQIQKNYHEVLQGVKKLQNCGFTLEYKEFAFKSIGKQKLPIKVRFETLMHYLDYIQKKDEYNEFTLLYETIVKRYPTLQKLFVKKPFILLEYKEVWDQLLAVLDFLLANPHPNIYIRELSIASVDTKFIEKYKKILDTLYASIENSEPISTLANYAFEKKYVFLYKEPTIRFRILDEELFIDGLSDISLPQSQFQMVQLRCEKVFIVENKITTLSFPKLKSAIVIFGQGYGVSVLKDISWLSKKQIFYWGDIDLDGYAILSQLRGYFPQAISLFMDFASYEKYSSLGVYYSHLNLPNLPKTLLNLKENEKRVYDTLCQTKRDKLFRIEQERIPFCDITKGLSKL